MLFNMVTYGWLADAYGVFCTRIARRQVTYYDTFFATLIRQCEFRLIFKCRELHDSPSLIQL